MLEWFFRHLPVRAALKHDRKKIGNWKKKTLGRLFKANIEELPVFDEEFTSWKSINSIFSSPFTFEFEINHEPTNYLEKVHFPD